MIPFALLGIVQGLTEFLPISSSGHLYILKRLLDIHQDYLSFFVFLHMATLFAIVFFLFDHLKLLFNKKLLSHIIFITFITSILALAIRFYLVRFFDSKGLVAFCYIINAGILLSIKNKSSGRTWESIKFKDSLIIGILQGIAPFPGISRSGITIVGLLARGFDKKEAFVLSFLMAIPVILGAFILEFNQLMASNIAPSGMAVGFVSSFLSGLVALKLVKKALLLDKFSNFAYYCLVVSLISLLV